jgi:hypothetical protein
MPLSVQVSDQTVYLPVLPYHLEQAKSETRVYHHSPRVSCLCCLQEVF